MSPPSTRAAKRRRELKRTENIIEERTRTVRQAKTRVPASFLRHRLFALAQNEDTSLKIANEAIGGQSHIPKFERETNSGDNEESSDKIVCYRGSAAYAILKQLHHEPDDGIVFVDDQDKTQTWLNDEWNIDLTREVESKHETSISPPLLIHDDCRPNESPPEIVRRTEVLPQKKRFKFGDSVSVHQHGVQVGSGMSFACENVREATTHFDVDI